MPYQEKMNWAAEELAVATPTPLPTLTKLLEHTDVGLRLQQQFNHAAHNIQHNSNCMLGCSWDLVLHNPLHTLLPE